MRIIIFITLWFTSVYSYTLLLLIGNRYSGVVWMDINDIIRTTVVWRRSKRLYVQVVIILSCNIPTMDVCIYSIQLWSTCVLVRYLLSLLINVIIIEYRNTVGQMFFFLKSKNTDVCSRKFSTHSYTRGYIIIYYNTSMLLYYYVHLHLSWSHQRIHLSSRKQSQYNNITTSCIISYVCEDKSYNSIHQYKW